jgi:hypothetical protein
MPGKDLTLFGKSILKQLGGSLKDLDPAQAKYWGVNSPNNIFEVIPEEVGNVFLTLDHSYFKVDTEELEASIPLTRQDQRVKLAFWLEYEKAHEAHRKMDLEEVVTGTGIPNFEFYLTKLRDDMGLLAWFSRPPVSYMLEVREAHAIGMKRLMEILQLPLTEETKYGPKVNVGVGALILRAFERIEDRLYGPMVQKNVNVNIGADAPNADQAKVALSLEEIDKRLKELEPITRPGGTLPDLEFSKPEPKEVVNDPTE